MPWTWEYYLDKHGDDVVEEVLATLQPKGKDRAKIQAILTTCIGPTLGSLSPKGAAFHRVNEFWQLRSNQCRILAKENPHKSRVLVLIHAFIKKQQDTPLNEILRAQNIWTEFISLENSELQRRQALYNAKDEEGKEDDK